MASFFVTLSVVMAVVALSAQNMAGRFSPRLLRVRLRNLADMHRDDEELSEVALEPPPGAVGVVATRSGHLVDMDTEELHQLAVAHGS